jgi:hypothetical protein
MPSYLDDLDHILSRPRIKDSTGKTFRVMICTNRALKSQNALTAS